MKNLFAEKDALKFANRVSAPIIAGATCWILVTLIGLKGDNQKFLAELEAHSIEIANHESRINSIETALYNQRSWREVYGIIVAKGDTKPEVEHR